MPLRNQLHVDSLLSNISVKYRNTEFIADKMFPIVSVMKDSDLYRVYDRNFRIPETKRAMKAESREHDYGVSTQSYVLERHGLKNYVSDSEADNYDIADLRSDMTEELTDVIMRRRERSVALLMTSTSWSLNVSLAAANAFNQNTISSDPIVIFDTGSTEVIQNSGHRPNYAVIPRTSKIAIKNHTSVLDRIKYTNALMTNDLLKGLLDVEEILEPIAQYDTSEKGGTTVLADIFDADKCFVGYKPSSPGPMQPSAGYLFQKSLPMVKRWRDEAREAEAIEVNMAYVPKVVASLSGFLIIDTLA